MEPDTTVRIDAALAAVPATMTVYRTEGPRTFARDDRDVRDLVAKRVRRWTEAFPTDAEARDLGDRVLLIDDRQALEVFVPTESMWWSNRATAFAEQPPSEPLPEPETAEAEALAAIGRLGASGADWTVARVGTVNAGMSRSPDDPGELVATMVTVVLGLTYDGLPAVGPGARTRVSFGGGGELAEFAQFWRDVRAALDVTPLGPEQALERLAADARFSGVFEAGLTVVVDGFRLAHFAAGPSVSQRYLVPVYEAGGYVEGSEAEDDRFNLFVPAVDADPADLKTMMVRDRPGVRAVFGSF